MIFRSLAEFGFSSEDVLDMTPCLTRIYYSSKEALDNADEHKESRIRANLEYYKDKRILKLKYERELERHLANVGEKHKQDGNPVKKWIVDKVRYG